LEINFDIYQADTILKKLITLCLKHFPHISNRLVQVNTGSLEKGQLIFVY